MELIWQRKTHLTAELPKTDLHIWLYFDGKTKSYNIIDTVVFHYGDKAQTCDICSQGYIVPYLFGYKMGFSCLLNNTKILFSPMKFCYKIISFLNNAKDLALSSKTELDLWDCFRREKLNFHLITEEIW